MPQKRSQISSGKREHKMTLEKALEIVKLAIATKNEKNEVIVNDMLEFSVAVTVIQNNLTPQQIDGVFNE
jgi:hypothetical protein